MKRIYIAIALNLQYLPDDLITRIVKQRPYWRDLEKRLQVMPSIPLGHEDKAFTGNNPEQVIRYAIKKKAAIYYGYFIRTDGVNTTIEPHAFCVDNGRVIEPSSDYTWEGQGKCYYVGIPVPFGDIVDRRFELKFEQMKYVYDNLRMI